jgi:20S proteasome alpha/beta subunit
MGRNSDVAHDKLKDTLKNDMTMADLIKLGIEVLKEATDEDFEDKTIQVAKVEVKDALFKLLTEAEVKEYLK